MRRLGRFLPQTLAGVGLFGLLAVFAPLVLPWALPVIAGFALSIPLAVWTASQAAARWSRRTGIGHIPEDVAPPLALRDVLAEAARSRHGIQGDEWREARAVAAE